ncbi:hypothetical protein ACWCQN_18030, partial [Streptomyces sp. NPDC001984]
MTALLRKHLPKRPRRPSARRSVVPLPAAGQPSISASASGTVSAGDSITINGSGFAAGEQV